MSATVAAGSRSVVHAASQGVSLAFPDICRTPAALGAPLPYPNLARSADAAKTARRTSADGQALCTRASEWSTSTGDEAGSAGGIVSGRIRGRAHPVSAATDVIVEGSGILRAFDLLLHNDRNTPPFPILQPPLPTLPARTRIDCLICGDDTDPAAPGRHLPAGALDEIHARQVRRACTDGGACLWPHRPGWEETSCCHRWQAAQAARAGIGASYGPLPPDAFRDRRSPCWLEVHHLVPPRLLHEAIDAACAGDGAAADLCRLALLHAGYNINHGRNLLGLPLLPEDARRLALPRRLVLDPATVGIPPALAGAWAGLNLYDEILRHLLRPLLAVLAASLHPQACTAPGPAPGAAARAALEALSDLIRGIICAPNRALGLLP